MSEIEINFNPFAHNAERQANEQEFTFGDWSQRAEGLRMALIVLQFSGCLSDGLYDKVRKRVNKKLMKHLRPL